MADFQPELGATVSWISGVFCRIFFTTKLNCTSNLFSTKLQRLERKKTIQQNAIYIYEYDGWLFQYDLQSILLTLLLRILLQDSI